MSESSQQPERLNGIASHTKMEPPKLPSELDLGADKACSAPPTSDRFQCAHEITESAVRKCAIVRQIDQATKRRLKSGELLG